MIGREAVLAHLTTRVAAKRILDVPLSTVGQILPVFVRALRNITADVHAPLDVHSLWRAQDLPTTISAALRIYFDDVWRVQNAKRPNGQSGLEQVLCFASALSHLQRRMPFIYAMWALRVTEGIAVGPGIEHLHTEFQGALEALNEYIRDRMPCAATKLFPGLGVVTCEESLGTHRSDGDHKSSRSYERKGVAKATLQRLGLVKPVLAPCEWAGDFERPPTAVLARTDLDIAQVVARVAAFSKDREAALQEVLKDISEKDVAPALADMKEGRVCLFCAVNPLTRVNECGHSMCKECSALFSKPAPPVCPLDRVRYDVAMDELPVGSGYRILSIDGGGVKGIAPALILAEIERRCGFSALQLFDFVTGTSIGGIVAMSMFVAGGARRSAEDSAEKSAGCAPTSWHPPAECNPRADGRQLSSSGTGQAPAAPVGGSRQRRSAGLLSQLAACLRDHSAWRRRGRQAGAAGHLPSRHPAPAGWCCSCRQRAEPAPPVAGGGRAGDIVRPAVPARIQRGRLHLPRRRLPSQQSQPGGAQRGKNAMAHCQC